MKMCKFRVQNYKKINDSGWINIKDFTTFVGKNESGKSALFRGLSKLNPSDKSTYDGLKEFPRRRYTDEFSEKNYPVSSAEFELNDDEKSVLSDISASLKNTETIVVTKYYNNKYNWNFNPEISEFELPTNIYNTTLENWKDFIEKSRAPEGKGEILKPIKTNLISIIDQQIKSITDLEFISKELISEIFSKINSQISEDWQEPIFKKLLQEICDLLEKFKINAELDSANDWFFKNMPKFIYFDRYDILDSAIHIDDFIRNMKEHPDDSKLRITKCLFEHVGLDLNEISKLDLNDDQKTRQNLERMADERAIKMSAASQAMTQKFTSWWEQRKHNFRYQIDGKNFRVWVSDDLDPSEIELDQRSAGMQYFFSFYLVFLVEANIKHTNSILLLDEPGLQFHGTAQQKTVEFLKKISKDNQLLYTTHSPFMIDGDHLENVKIVFEDVDDFGTTKRGDA